jgi:hypothetical protein
MADIDDLAPFTLLAMLGILFGAVVIGAISDSIGEHNDKKPTATDELLSSAPLSVECRTFDAAKSTIRSKCGPRRKTSLFALKLYGLPHSVTLDDSYRYGHYVGVCSFLDSSGNDLDSANIHETALLSTSHEASVGDMWRTVTVPADVCVMRFYDKAARTARLIIYRAGRNTATGIQNYPVYSHDMPLNPRWFAIE